MFIEALSNLPLAEANWVTHQINLHTELVGNIPHKIVAYADLTQDSNVVEELLSAYVSFFSEPLTNLEVQKSFDCWNKTDSQSPS